MTKVRAVNYLAGMHKDFPVKKALDVFCDIPSPGLGLLYGTFGTKERILKRFFKCAERGYLQIYFSNEVGRRKGNLYKGEFKRRWNVHKMNQKLEQMSFLTKRAIHRRTRRILAAVSRHKGPDDRVVLFVGLEDNYTGKAARELIRAVREVWPYEVGRNPVGHNPNQSKVGADLLEKHGIAVSNTLSSAECWSNDGVDIRYGQARPIQPNISLGQLGHRLQAAKQDDGIRLLWIAEQQGLYGDSGSAPPPRKRNIKVTKQAVNALNQLLRQM